ncbi:MAG: hypothetical protein Q7T03_07320 [Deltaproteobacteria bacterium]|nr:hypothetical protein [Deltaproteobacteria bacterium]
MPFKIIHSNPTNLVFPLLLLGLLAVGCGSGSSGGGTAAAQSVTTGSGGTTSSAPASMSVGDISIPDFSGSSATISFSGVPSGSTYELLIQSQATDTSSRTYVLGDLNLVEKSLGVSNALSDEVLSDGSATVQAKLDGLMRNEENLLADFAVEGAAKSVSKSAGVSVSKASGDPPPPSVALSVNDTDTFRVLSSLSDVTQYTEVTATVKCVNDTVAIYVDAEIDSTNPADFTQANANTLCASFKTSLTTVTGVFGGFADINSDGVAVALITPAVNRLGASNGGIVTGFYYAGDSFTRSSSIPASNYREIVYLVSPDSAGVYGSKISNSFAMSNFLPAVFPHEMQHLISYYQHVTARGGAAEEYWLNESISHFVEDLVGYGRENYSRYDLFLASPQSYSLVSTASTGLAQRGAGYLFIRYLYEQSGNSATFLNNLVNTTRVGTANVVAAYPSPPSDFNEFGEFLKRWSVALAYTNRSLTSSAKFQYNARTINSSTNNYEGVCMICTASDGRGTILSGPSFGTYSASNYSLRGTATRFLRLSSSPSSVTITPASGSSPAAVILRTQ